VIGDVAASSGSEVITVRRDRDWSFDGDVLCSRFTSGELRPALFGEHQAENAALALALLHELDRAGVAPVPDFARRAAIEHVAWPGRFDVREVEGSPVVFDVAHNAAGARVLSTAVQTRYAGKRVALVVGMLHDKAHEPFLRAVAPLTRDVTAVTPDHPERKLEAAALAGMFTSFGVDAAVAGDPAAAVRDAARRADVVVVTGSLFTVGDAMRGLGIRPGDEPIHRPVEHLEAGA